MDLQDRARAWLDGADKADGTFALVCDLNTEVERLRGLINSPVTNDWIEGVRTEVVHQQERWGNDHDAGKTNPDWFWLVGYLAGKALFAAMQGDVEKARHHTISTGAALLNWWRHIGGAAPSGINPPVDPQ